MCPARRVTSHLCIRQGENFLNRRLERPPILPSHIADRPPGIPGNLQPAAVQRLPLRPSPQLCPQLLHQETKIIDGSLQGVGYRRGRVRRPESLEDPIRGEALRFLQVTRESVLKR